LKEPSIAPSTWTTTTSFRMLVRSPTTSSKRRVIAWSFDHPIVVFDDEYYMLGAGSIGPLYT
jgi:hypothetical protein